MSDWYVYILRCADGSLYTGSTVDVERRVREHNSNDKLAARYTRARRPLQLVYSEKLSNRSEALSREAQLKAMKKRDKEKLLPRFETE